MKNADVLGPDIPYTKHMIILTTSSRLEKARKGL